MRIRAVFGTLVAITVVDALSCGEAIAGQAGGARGRYKEMVLRSKRARSGANSLLASHTIGNALVVHPAGVISAESRSLAMAIAQDDQNHLVILDLPPEPPVGMWDLIADLLPGRRQGIRLVLRGRSRETMALAAHWLAERSGRTVIAPDGSLTGSVGGSLFVEPAAGTGWLRYRSGQRPQPHGRRFPRPTWDVDEASQTFSTSARFVAEPLPAGLWVRPVGEDTVRQRYWDWLIRNVSCQPGVLTVLLGAPGSPPVSVDDVATVWTRMPEAIRSALRFVQFGQSRSEPMPLGQRVADLLGTTVTFLGGVPMGGAEEPAMYTIDVDGKVGWHVFARELGYRPGSTEGAQTAVLISHREPLAGIEEIEPGVYRYTMDTVVEVIQAGLWLRLPEAAPHADAIRATRSAPMVNQVVFDQPDGSTGQRLKQVAQDLLARLDPQTRQLSRVVPVSAFLRGQVPDPVPQRPPHAQQAPPPNSPAAAAPSPSSPPAPPQSTSPPPMPPARSMPPTPPVPVPPPGWSLPPLPDLPADAHGTVALHRVTRTEVLVPRAAKRVPTLRGGIRFQQAPDAEAAALPPDEGIEDERAWLRGNLAEQYAAIAETVLRIVSKDLDFQSLLASAADEVSVLTDAIALFLYLSPDGDTVDEGLRSRTVGPHVPFARCALSGLRYLPGYEGPAVFAATPSADELRLYRQSTVFTDWGFVHALTAPSLGAEGTFDVLLWSINARRTELLEPDPAAGGVADRVVFPPGSRFKVLLVIEPTSTRRGQILLRELDVDESVADGTVESGLSPMDDVAVTSLRTAFEGWAAAPQRRRVGDSASTRFGPLPGLVAVRPGDGATGAEPSAADTPDAPR
jgi:hypothetical protein